MSSVAGDGPTRLPGPPSRPGVKRGWRFGVLVATLVILGHAPEEGRCLDTTERGLLAPRTVALTYRMQLPDLPENARSVAVWIPLPRETTAQQVEKLRIDADLAHRIVSDPVYGNRYLYLESGEAPPSGLDVVLEFVVRRHGYEAVHRPPGGKDPEPPGDLARFLQPDRLVPIDGEIAALSAKVLDGAGAGNLEKARLLYEHVLASMEYDKSGEGWGKGDALYACRVGSGNCTDFHSFFIGLARAAGIPARFVMGLPLPPGEDQGEIAGYHCWAEFYDKGVGWVPIDASEAWKHPEQREFLFGGLDANRMEFTVGRDIPLVPVDKAEGAVLNYSIYPFVVVDGAVFDGAETTFTFQNLAG